MENQKKSNKKQNIFQLALVLVFIVLLNIIGSFVFTRFDLTSEKRYTLSPATKKMLSQLEDVVYFKIYLDGDFPAGFKRLQKETKEILDEFHANSKNIQYEFINPTISNDNKETGKIYEQLIQKGLTPTNLQVKSEGTQKQQIIFPGAIVSYRGTEYPLQLLINQIGVPPDAVLNNSIQQLEYNISRIIKILTKNTRSKIAFIDGQGELDRYQTADLILTLFDSYDVERIKIDQKLSSLKGFNAIVIAKPTQKFNDKDKYIIDQFIMKGGKVLWFIDPVFASMDSLAKTNETVAFANDLNIEDMLFRYGVRLNTNLIMDLNAIPIPVTTGKIGNQPQISLLPWYYFPMLTPTLNHPITNNLNAIKTEFVSSLDTVGFANNGLTAKKTILLTTSKYSKLINTPARISLETLRREPDKNQYSKAFQPIAILLEGKFESIFKNRISPDFIESTDIASSKEYKFRDSTDKPTKMIVVSDGDMIKNLVDYSNTKPFPLPLGYDKYTRQTYGNKDFVLNAIDYLLDENGLITVRSKEIKLRMLDKTKIHEGKLFWQIINTIVPVLIIVIFGIVKFFIRKKRYTKFKI